MQQAQRQWMKKIALLAAVAGGLAMPASHAQAQTLRLLSSWAENDRPSYINGVIFQKHVKEVSDGKLTISINGPEAVPPFEQLQPVSAGVFDILYTHGAYHVGSRGSRLPQIPLTSISTSAAKPGFGASSTSTTRRHMA